MAYGHNLIYIMGWAGIDSLFISFDKQVKISAQERIKYES
jgi:hypothetical protein